MSVWPIVGKTPPTDAENTGMNSLASPPRAAARRILTYALSTVCAFAFTASASANYGYDPMVAVGAGHACALDNSGEVKCWGANAHGQLGTGTTVDATAPTALASVVAAKAASPEPPPSLGAIDAIAAASDSTCALSLGMIWCWGANDHGQLGLGTVDGDPHPTPQVIAGSKDFYTITAGSDHFCASTWQGQLSCWGSNAAGQIGNGTVGGDVAAPSKVSGVSKFLSIAAGNAFSCVLPWSGKPTCWGDGSAAPKAVVGVVGMQELVAGAASICAWGWGKEAVSCWPGAGSGSPAAVAGLVDVSAFGGTAASTCAVAKTVLAANTRPWSKSRSLQCWGDNTLGQLGTGDTLSSATPRSVKLDNVAALSVGSSASQQCAILVAGAVHCWGAGQLLPVVVGGVDLVTRAQHPEWASVEPTSRLRSNRSGSAWRLKVRVDVMPSRFTEAKAACTGRVSVAAYYYKRVRKAKSAQTAIEKKKVGVRKLAKLRRSGEYCKADATVSIPRARFAGKLRKMYVNAASRGNKTMSTFDTGEFAIKDVRKILKQK